MSGGRARERRALGGVAMPFPTWPWSVVPPGWMPWPMGPAAGSSCRAGLHPPFLTSGRTEASSSDPRSLDRGKKSCVSELLSWKVHLGLVSRCCSAACAGPSVRRLQLSIPNRAEGALKSRQPASGPKRAGIDNFNPLLKPG